MGLVLLKMAGGTLLVVLALRGRGFASFGAKGRGFVVASVVGAKVRGFESTDGLGAGAVACVCVCMYVCMYEAQVLWPVCVCVYVCMCVCVFVCMYV